MWFGSRTWLTTSGVLCRKSTDFTWDEDEPSAAMAEEDSAPAAEESAPAPVTPDFTRKTECISRVR
jgi:hypothetical protein